VSVADHPGGTERPLSSLTVVNPVDMQAPQMREEQVGTAGFLPCRGMLHIDLGDRSLMISSWSRKIFTKRPHPRTASDTITFTDGL
jgi:hypothetical protein